MTLAAVQGQPRALDALRSALKGGTLHHAYLFAGPEGVGKELAAIGLAQALVCPVKKGEGCGECSACGRVARRNHPDVTVVMPEEEMIQRGFRGRSDFDHAPSRDIRVEQIRGLQERLSLRPLEASKKVVIVASAARMNDPAQNAFLTTLEEPPRETVIVLITSQPDELLPTIRSRCARIGFAPLPAEMIVERLKKERKLDEMTARLVAVMSGGSMSRALEFDVDGLAQRKDVIERFEALKDDDARTFMRFAEDFGKTRPEAEEVLAILAIWGHDVAVAKAGGRDLANGDLAELATQAAARVSDLRLQRWGKLVQDAADAISIRNASPRLQLERMLIELSR